MRTLSLAALLIASLVACGEKSGGKATWSRVEPAAMSDGQQAQQKKGLAAKDALFSKLFIKLQAAFTEGPGAAISACQVAAPEIAAAVSAEQGLRIGRTSHRLRNPKNVTPAWAEKFVEAETGEPVWLAHGDGRLAGLLPIRTMRLCLMCHGQESSIVEPIRAALKEHYPEDKATGFAEGDLRGWFWLEIPAQ